MGYYSCLLSSVKACLLTIVDDSSSILLEALLARNYNWILMDNPKPSLSSSKWNVVNCIITWKTTTRLETSQDLCLLTRKMRKRRWDHNAHPPFSNLPWFNVPIQFDSNFGFSQQSGWFVRKRLERCFLGYFPLSLRRKTQIWIYNYRIKPPFLCTFIIMIII
jgi:hypothetical protein